MDIVTAFLNGELEEDIYMKPPPGIDFGPGTSNKTCHLLKSLYGLKQAPRVWNDTIDTALLDFGFKRSMKDPCIYYLWRDDKLLILGLYVDDLVIACDCDELLADAKKFILSTYDAKDMGEIRFLLGMLIEYDRKNRTLDISQTAYVERLLTKFRMDNCKPASTPIVDAMSMVILNKDTTSQKRLSRELHSSYRSGVGGLLYLARCTRPDISFAISFLSRFLSDPFYCHWNALLRVFAYLRGTTKFGISYGRKNVEGTDLHAFTDASHASDPADRKSIGGFCVFLNGGPVSWGSRKQKTLTALSSFEAEYVALTDMSKDVLFIRHLLEELGSPVVGSTTIWCDNDSSIANCNNAKISNRNKHVQTRYHYIREHVDQT